MINIKSSLTPKEEARGFLKSMIWELTATKTSNKGESKKKFTVQLVQTDKVTRIYLVPNRFTSIEITHLTTNPILDLFKGLIVDEDAFKYSKAKIDESIDIPGLQRYLSQIDYNVLDRETKERIESILSRTENDVFHDSELSTMFGLFSGSGSGSDSEVTFKNVTSSTDEWLFHYPTDAIKVCSNKIDLRQSITTFSELTDPYAMLSLVSNYSALSPLQLFMIRASDDKSWGTPIESLFKTNYASVSSGRKYYVGVNIKFAE